MSLKLITAPTAPVVALATVKLHLHVDSSEEDALITSLIAAAHQLAEHHTGISIGAQTWQLALDAFPAGAILLPRGPVTAISSVTYVDTAEDTQTLSSSLYTLDDYAQPAWLVPAYSTDWPSTLDVANAVKVQYTTGAATVPPTVVSAILLAVGHWHSNREAVGPGSLAELPLGVRALLDTVKDWSRGG